MFVFLLRKGKVMKAQCRFSLDSFSCDWPNLYFFASPPRILQGPFRCCTIHTSSAFGISWNSGGIEPRMVALRLRVFQDLHNRNAWARNLFRKCYIFQFSSKEFQFSLKEFSIEYVQTFKSFVFFLKAIIRFAKVPLWTIRKVVSLWTTSD